MRHQLETCNGRSARLPFRPLVAAMSLVMLSLSPATWAQAASPSDRYQPERTREDYAAAPEAGDDYDYAAQTLRVSVWLDRDEDEIYRRGDEQRIGFQTNEDAYAVVYRIDTDGLVTILWPRDRFDDGFVFGGNEYRLPGREASALRIDEQEGEGYVQAIVSRYPFDLRALELDFLTPDSGKRYDFHVAGDPFLAMNEVNYAVTGLEDAGDQVITNYARYYVHKVVDHPRYLCSQCHTGDSVRYDPYDAQCSLSIEYDYGWSNRWYTTYGYYPAYWNPVYVYVDPWTWRPWVNFWYDPWYVCAPYNGWRGPYWGSYAWYDSPYYGGGCGPRWDGGGRRYQPLNRHGDGVAVRKSHEYDSVSRLVNRERPGSSEREAMLARRPLAGRAKPGQDGRSSIRGDAPVTVVRGDKPMARPTERFDGAGTSGQGGLRIRSGGRGGAGTGTDANTGLPTRRHTAAGADQRASLAPVRPVVRGNDGELRQPSAPAGGVRGGDNGAARGSERDGIRALNPRQRGSRVWNGTNGRSAQPAERPDRPTRVRPGRDAGTSREEAAPTPRQGGNDGDRRGPAPSARRGGTNPRAGETGRQPSQPAPRVREESTRSDPPSAPAQARPAPTRRQEAPRAAGSEDRESAKSPDAPARRTPVERKK